jgi:hypothetical protein
MMDLFREESVHKVNTGLNVVVLILAWVGLILFGFLTLIMLAPLFGGTISIPAIIGSVVFGGLTYLCFIVRNNQKIEYDYTFTNGTFDIAKVVNNTRRKKLLTAEIKEFEAIAPTSDDGFPRMLQHPGIKKYNYFLNRGGGLYYGVFTKGGQKSILIFEPSDELVRMFKMVNPRNVKTN